MSRRSIRSLVLCAGAALAASLVPAAPATAMGPCQGKSAFGVTEWTQTVVVAGAYTTATATDVHLTCGIVRNGRTVAYVYETVPGPVAALTGTKEISGGPFSMCYVLTVRYPDHTTYSDTCP